MSNTVSAENQSPSKALARRHLRRLDPVADSFTFQTYDDDKARNDKSLARTIVGTLDDCWPRLVAANANGCAVHVTINSTVGARRTAKSVDRIRKHFIEIDGTATLEQILAGPFKPEWINESSPGKYHVYFANAGDVADDLKGFKPRQMQLATRYNSGRESVDLPRVLRLPGFLHQKDPSNPFLVKTVYSDNDAPRYSVADYLAMLGEITVAPTATVERAEEPAAPENDAAIAAVIELFKEADPAISNTPTGKSGKQGNDTTYALMQRARDEGVERETCLDLALTYYNPRCEPEWSLEELEAIVNNAYQYGQNTQGKDNASADFDDEEPVTPKNPEAAKEKAAEINTKGRARAINKIRKLREITEANKSAPEEITKARKDEAKWIERYSLTEDDLAGDAPTDVSEGSSGEWYDITRQWVHVGRFERFLDLVTREMWRTTAFDNHFAAVKVMDKDKNAPLSKYIFRNRSLPMYKSVAYRPGGDAVINGNFNMWLRSDIDAVEGDTTIFDAHMEYLFPGQDARDRVLNWLAWVYQNQDKKPRHALLIHGEIPGTGKSFIAHMLSRLLGRYLPSGVLSGTTTIKGGTLEAAHSGWEFQTKLVVVEEVRPGFGSSQAVVKGLHDLISEPTILVDKKNLDPETILNLLAFLLFSNKLDALTLDNSDRRYEIESVDLVPGSTKLMPKDKAYYIALYGLLDDPVAMAAFAYQLEKRDLGDYSGLSAAPLTAIKTVMADETRDDLERWFDDNVGVKPLRYSLVTLDEVHDVVPGDLRRPGWRKRVSNLMRSKLKGVDIGQVRFGGTHDPRRSLWAINGRVDRKVASAIGGHKKLTKLYRTEHDQLTPYEKAARAEANARRTVEAQAEFAEVDAA